MLTATAVVLLLAMLGASRAEEPTGVEGPDLPGIDVGALSVEEPGWTIVDSSGDATEGSLSAERAVWPMFYLHWKPIPEGDKQPLGIEEARQVVAGLWEGLVIDTPLEGRQVKYAQHPAIEFETTTQHGGMKTRYVAWKCPQSLRLIVADMNLGQKASAPEELLDWQRAMVPTIRCHTTVIPDPNPLLAARYRIPGAELSFAHPERWMPVPQYRIQTRFGEANPTKQSPGSTAREGQSLTLARDAQSRLDLFWKPEEDYPMTYDEVKLRVEDYWRTRSRELMITKMRTSGGLWIAEGLARVESSPTATIPTIVHKFRSWVWREKGQTYLAVARTAPLRFGNKDLRMTEEMWDRSFQTMFSAIHY